MTQELRVRGVAGSHPGCVREQNEDSYCERPDIGLWAVADGMGGHEHGERASAALVTALRDVAAEPDFELQIGMVADAIHLANREVYDAAKAAEIQMGSTVVALLIVEGSFAIAWAGDSRAYLLRNGTLYRLSTDHTQVQEMLDHGLLTPEQAQTHPFAHILSRAVGVADRLELDVIVDVAMAGDVFLLCSDGLTAVVSEPEITEMMIAHEGGDLVDSLIALCLSRGAPDNVTLCAVDVSEATLLVLGEGADGG
jgi:serine/threonine protein phosphatase PrpC